MRKHIRVLLFSLMIILSCKGYIPSISKEEAMYGIYMTLVLEECDDYLFINIESDGD